jgi:hypothetical protein
VDTGSREENASKQKIDRSRDSIQSERALALSVVSKDCVECKKDQPVGRSSLEFI